jgi:hypothetical protein
VALDLVALGIDAFDPTALAPFWAEALGWDVGAVSPEGVVPLLPTDGTRFRIELVPTTIPKAGKNPIHLDLTTASLDDQRGSTERFVALGAAPADVGQGPDVTHVVLADPEGNELCLIEPDNTFLAGCGRLGSITCDGSVAVGHFWSAALGWPLVWDQDEETAIRAPDLTGPLITWGPPVPDPGAPSRWRLHLAPTPGSDRDTEVARLVALGATVVAGSPVAGDLLADPDGNELRIVAARA